MYDCVPVGNGAYCEMVTRSLDIECFIVADSFETGHWRTRDDVGSAIRYTPVAAWLRRTGISSITDMISTWTRARQEINLRWISGTEIRGDA